MHVTAVDPTDTQAFAAWFAVQAASEQDARPDEPGYLEHEVRAVAVEGAGPDPDSAVVLLAAVDGDAVVGALRADLPQRDNLHLAEVELHVLPGQRRRGAARSLVDALEARLRADGRTTAVG